MLKKSFRKMAAGVLAMAMLANIPFYTADADEMKNTYYGEKVTISAASDYVRENNFNKGWKFYPGTSSTAQNQGFDDSAWETVDLPHDFSITQAFTNSGEAESGFLPGGTGWYRKSFTMPESMAGQTVLLNFDGVYSDAYVYVNGEFIGEHHYGYTSFAFDISEKLIFDGATENIIAVKTVNHIPNSRWYSGSGIYRNVTLMVTDPVHVDLNGTKITTPDISSGSGTVNVTIDVVNDSDTLKTITVKNIIKEKGNETTVAEAETTVTISAGAAMTAETNPIVANPKLWSIETPNLYEVHTVLSVDGVEVDSYDSTFGFRYFSFDNSGFHLNGENVKLKGVCMHHDQGALGSAAYYDAIYRQMSIMKDMGCNAIRTAHNPASKDLIEICSELGLLVIEEAFDGLVDYKNENLNDFSKYFETALGSENSLYNGSKDMTYSEFAARSMVKRDRNAPSIIAWSFGNEIQEGTYWTNISRYDEIAADFITWINEEDGTRPATSGDNNRGGDSRLVDVINVITNSGGIAGFNYANSASTLYSLAQNYGGNTGAIIASETSSAVNSRSIYTSQASASNADGKYHLTSYDTSSVSWGITAHDSIYNTYQYDCVAGEFVWTGFDYIGEPTPWNGTSAGSISGSGAIPNSSYFGIVETTGFEKDTYYLYRSQWNKETTTLHLVTAWASDNMMTSNGKTPVWVYSNAPVVKLYRDDALIGTATRDENKSAAGHIYYTYTTESNNSSVCTTSSGSGADGLFAVFNVAYTAGTLSAKAFEADGTTEIALTGNSGKNTVTTPGTVTKLEVSANNTTVEADGSSLTYVEVDVTDAASNLDTTATNHIIFTLTGNGEIVGVDNGDQATTAKYQQSSVLTGSTSANINAYAGKALAIVRSTEDAGSFTVQASSSGLTGGSATVTTTSDETSSDQNGLVSYTMIRDYSVKAGTVPTLDNTVTGTMADGSVVSGTIVWDEITEEMYQNAGDYTLKGTVTFDGLDPIIVTGRLHVIANVIAMRNISTVTMTGVVPTLPSTVAGVLQDGTVTCEFNVTWEDVTAEELDTVGEIVVVNGTATVLGTETLPVTCSIRVAEAIATESSNIAGQADGLYQDIAESMQSDTLDSVNNGNLKPGDNTSERWTNWNNRTTSAEATLEFTWATAHMISSVNIYYYYDNCCAYPENIEFSYSLNGQDYVLIEAEASQVETYSLGAQYSYTFAEPVNPVGLRIKFTQQNGTNGNHCVGVTEIEVMTYIAELEYNSSADLAGIIVDNVLVENFAADTLLYEAVGSHVQAETTVNAGVTVLPEYEGVVRILTVSEDGTAAKTYEVTLTEDVCTHENTEVRNAAESTCSASGYTGDTYCTDCGKRLAEGTVIVRKAHTTTRINVKEASCTETGYTGDSYCSVCNTVISTGTTIAAKGHSYGEGVSGENGLITYTCTVCGDKFEKRELSVPKVSISVEKASDHKMKITGTFKDYENSDQYYEVTGKGLVYISSTRLGSKTLTVHTSGRTKVTCKTFSDEGTFSYTMKPTNASAKYTIKAYLSYIDGDGVLRYAYSSQVVTTLNQLSQ